jgi:hypothetical protein
MGMVFTDDIADDTRRLLIGLIPVVVHLVHGEEHTTMHWLEAIAGVGRARPTITLMA